MQWAVWLAFASLCILSGTSWVIPSESFGGLPPLEEQAGLFSGIGLIALLFAGRGIWSRADLRRRVQLGGAAIGFLGIPIVVVECVRGGVPSISRSALFAIVPVVVILVLAAGEGVMSEERGIRRFLIPALAGLGGLLLLLPLQFSGSARGWGMLGAVCAAVILVGLASVWLYRLLNGVRFVEAIAVVGVANSIALLGCSVFVERSYWHWNLLSSIFSLSSLVDVVEVLLIVWLLREMQPVRFAARYLVIPLLTIVEGYVLVRPEVNLRMVVGTLLLLVGAGMLLFWKTTEEETTLSLR
jgi:hypothetical protein